MKRSACFGGLAIGMMLMSIRVCVGETDKGKEVEVQADGNDQRSAITDGLKQAIEQINGVSVDDRSVILKEMVDEVTDLKSSFKDKTASSDDVKTASNGLVDDYQILEQTTNSETKMVHLKMRVKVHVFDPAAAYLRRPEAFEQNVVAIVVEREKEIDADLGDGLAKCLLEKNLLPESDFFNTAFVSSGVFEALFERASWNEVSKLQLPRRCQYIMLASKTERLKVKPRGGGADDTGSIDIRVFRSLDGKQVDKVRISTTAFETNEDGAKARLNEKLLDLFKEEKLGNWVEMAQKHGA